MGQIDTLIRGGRVVDGTGNPWFHADVALADGRVLDVRPPGVIDAGRAAAVVDASGMVVCPGFIDIQSHSIVPLMIDGRCLSKIAQGVTTEIMGEAWTPAPFGGRIRHQFHGGSLIDRAPGWRERGRSWTRFGDWLEAMAGHGVSPNVGSFLGGGTVREYVKGLDMGPADADELARMREVVEGAMRDGAFGIACALIYPPEAYTTTDEIVELCRVVAAHRGVYITHLRSEGDGLLQGIEEALEIGRRAEVPVEIYHLKAAGRRNWHRMTDAIAAIEAARADGLDVTADMYPYVGAGTGLSAVVPPWVAADGRLFENLRDAGVRARARAEMLRPSGEWEALADLAGPEGVMPIGFERPEHLGYIGMRLSEIAEARGQDWVDTVFDLLVDEGQRIASVYFLMCEENLVEQLRQPWMKISTDAGGYDPAWAEERGPIHPRSYGTYPRVLGRYVREQRVLGLEDAVRKMSSATADRLGIRDRGLLRAGFHADVVVLDPATVADRATFEEPHRLPTGIRDVWVNGVRVLEGGAHTGATPGRVLLR